MKLKKKVLNFLIEHKTEEFSIKSISDILKKDYKNTYETIQNMISSLNISKKGHSSFISFKPVLTIDIFETEIDRRENIAKKIPVILKDIQNIDNPFFVAVLFGSYAKDSEKKNSDIDLCIIHDNEKEVRKIEERLTIHPSLEIHTFGFREFKKMLMNKEFNVSHEIYKDGIILRNIESYYKLIKNA